MTLQDLNVVLSYPTFTVGRIILHCAYYFYHTGDDESAETLMDEQVWLQHLVSYKFLDGLTI